MFTLSMSFASVSEAMDFLKRFESEAAGEGLSIDMPLNEKVIDVEATVNSTTVEVKAEAEPPRRETVKAAEPETVESDPIGTPPAIFTELVQEVNGLGKDIMGDLAKAGKDKLRDEIVAHFTTPINKMQRAELDEAWMWLKKFKQEHLGGAN